MKKVVSVVCIAMLLICSMFVFPDKAVATTENYPEQSVTEVVSEEPDVVEVISETPDGASEVISETPDGTSEVVSETPNETSEALSETPIDAVVSEESADVVYSDTSDIGIYEDEECNAELYYCLDANKSKKADVNCFYVKYPKGETLKYKVGSRHSATIGANEDGDGGERYTFWRMESSENESISYYNYDEYYTPINDASLTGEFDDVTKHLDSIMDYIKIENVDVGSNEYSLMKVALKGKDSDNEFRGSEDFLFMFSLSDDWTDAKKLEINYGIEVEYDPSAISAIDTASNAFYDLCGIEREPEVTEVGTSQDGLKTVFFPRLGSFSTGRSDLRHGVGSEFWVELKDGYQITRIYDTIGQTELPYTASLMSYFKVYDGAKEVKIESLSDEDAWWGMTYIGSGGEDDTIIASAYTTVQELAKGTAENKWTKGDDSWQWFEVGYEDTSQFYNWCKEHGYTSELMGTNLVYKVYMPIEKQCKIKIETAKASNINSFTYGDTATDIRYNGNIDGFKASEVTLDEADKEAVNKKLKDYYNDEVELLDVYELNGKIKGSANIAIPVDNAKDYEIVWLAEKYSEDAGGNAPAELVPIPMLSVETAADDAKVMPVGHFSKYAIVGKGDGSGEGTKILTSNSGDGSGEGTKTPDSDKVDTGDYFNPMPFIIAMLISLAGIAVTMVRRRTN